jgi:hypothetical protein
MVISLSKLDTYVVQQEERILAAAVDSVGRKEAWPSTEPAMSRRNEVNVMGKVAMASIRTRR